MTGELPTQRASNAENVSIWWRHHAKLTAEVSRELSRDFVGRSVDSYTVSLHNHNGGSAVKAVPGDCQWPLKTVEIPTGDGSQQSLATEAIATYI